MLNEKNRSNVRPWLTVVSNAMQRHSGIYLCLMALTGMILLAGCESEEDDEVDLIVTDITAPPDAEAGTVVSVVSSIRNLGKVDALGTEYGDEDEPYFYNFYFYTGFRVGIYLSTDSIITKGDRLLGTWSARRLNSNSSDVDTTRVTIPEDTAPGIYYIGVIVDDQEMQDEKHEGNNTLAFEITITEPAPTAESDTTTEILTDPEVDPIELDLAVASVEDAGSGIYSPGNIIMIDNTIENRGNVAANLVTVAFYASADPEITTADYFLGECTIDILTPGSMDHDITICTIPDSIPEGFYFIGAIVDDTNELTESDETNNAGYASSSIEIITTSP